MRALICGGGIVGASIAYFLARRGVASTVIERSGLACAASGKGGGFLAAGWCDGTPVRRGLRKVDRRQTKATSPDPTTMRPISRREGP